MTVNSAMNLLLILTCINKCNEFYVEAGRELNKIHLDHLPLRAWPHCSLFLLRHYKFCFDKSGHSIVFQSLPGILKKLCRNGVVFICHKQMN